MSRRLIGPLSVLIVNAGLASVLWSVKLTSSLAPSHLDRASLTELINAQGPAAGAMSILRLTMFAASVYVAGLMVLILTARGTGRRNLERFVAGLTPRALRPVLGVLVVSSALLNQPAYAQGSDRAPVMIRVEDTRSVPSSTTSAMRPAPEATSPTTTGPTMRWVGPAPSSVEDTSPMPTTPTSSQVATWTVERGDHLWHIAEATLLGRLDRLPTVAETHGYWTVVIAANRDRLVDPDNPDLIYPGQEFVLPAT